jgi:uracil-DNA glycosylase
MLIGEQPGDQEDLEGERLVGAAGKLLDAALIEAGIDCAEVYVGSETANDLLRGGDRGPIVARPRF